MSSASAVPRPVQVSPDEPTHPRAPGLPRAPEPPMMEPSISQTTSENLAPLPEPIRMMKSGSRSPTYPHSPRYSHHGQYPPTPPHQTTPPPTNAYPSFYQHHQQLPHVSNYQPPRPINIPRDYPERRSDVQYGGQYPPTAPNSAHMQQPQSRRPSFARYPGGSELVRRISSQGYASHAPSEMGPSRHDMYPFEDAIDDGPIYGGRLSPPLSGFQGDPHHNLDGIIQRAQGAVTSLTLSIPSLQQLCDRYNAVNDELQRYYQIASEQDKDIEELQAKERQLEALKENMEQNLQMNTAEINRLKLKIADLEVEVKRLNASIETKDKERVAFEIKFNQEREALEQEFQKWKEETLTAHDNEKTSMVEGHDAEKRSMEEAFQSERLSLEEIHGTKTSDLEATHADRVRELQTDHESRLRVLEELHEAKVKNLEDSHAMRVKEIEEAFSEEKKSMENVFVEEKKGMDDVFAIERQRMFDEFVSEKLKMTEEFASQKLSMEEEFASEKHAIEDDFANQKIHLHQTFENEKTEMISSFETAKVEWGEEKEKIISDFKDEKSRLDEIIKGLEDDKQVLEDVKMTLEVDKAGLEGEKATLLDEKSTLLVEKTTLLDENSTLQVANTTLIDEKTVLLDERCTLLDEKSTLLGEKAALQDEKVGLEGAVATLEDQTATLQGDKEILMSEKERQKNEWESEKARLRDMIDQLELVKTSLLNDNNKLVETLKEVAEEEEGSEIRSRGDCFYIDAFQKLAKDIIDISSEFSSLPISPPSKVLAELPPGLPSMLGNSDASRLIRMAYVQHIISKYLCHRIFQPFLFSLGKRYDKADTFFQSMSNQLREKSTRKEAVWRHYTLLAGYTASNAKKNAGVAASSVIEEIAGYVKPFADQKNMDIITSGISRIVKFAVETWRYARMEREIITASMSMEGTESGSWECHSYERQSPYFENVLLTSQLKAAAAGRSIIIPLLPVFSREGTLPTLHRPLAVLDGGLVFSKGTALYTDCLPVLHRQYELNILQLPLPITIKKRVSQLAIDQEIEETKGEFTVTDTPTVVEVIMSVVEEHELSKMEDEAEKEIVEALKEAEIAVAFANATEIEALREMELPVLETVASEPEQQSVEADAICCDDSVEPTAKEPVIEELVSEVFVSQTLVAEETVTEEPVADATVAEELAAGGTIMEETPAEAFVPRQPAPEEFSWQKIALGGVIAEDIVVGEAVVAVAEMSEQEAPVAIEEEPVIPVQTVMANVDQTDGRKTEDIVVLAAEPEAKTEIEENPCALTDEEEASSLEVPSETVSEESQVESVLGGVDIEPELELELRGPKEVEIQGENEVETTEDAVSMCGPMSETDGLYKAKDEVTEDVEKPIKIALVNDSTDILAHVEPISKATTTEHEAVTMANLFEASTEESVSSGVTVEEADFEVITPKDESKEIKSQKPSRKSKLPKKLGPKKAKK